MSSFLIAAPEALATASADLSAMGETIRQATTVAAPSTMADCAGGLWMRCRRRLRSCLAGCRRGFQALSAQSALFHGQFVQLLSSGGAAYVGAEAANAAAAAAAAVPTAAAAGPADGLGQCRPA